MKRWLFFLITGLLAGTVYPVTFTDSAQNVFNDNEVYCYQFSFYITNWADSLEYYKELPDEPYLAARMLFYNENGDSIRLDSVGIRYKGNSSYQLAGDSPKKPIKVSFDKYKSDQRFYGLERLNFSNAVMDPSFMREKISYDIARNYMPAPRTAYANIYLEGNLIGFYVQIEQIDKKFLKNHFQDNDGNLYKAGDNGATLLYHDQNQSSYELDYSLKTNEDENDWSAFVNLIDKLNNTPDADFVSTVGQYLNLDNCIRHLAFTVALSNFDSYTGTGRNFYLYDDPDSEKFSILPWDLNLSFGAHTNNWNVFQMDIVNISNLNQRPLNRRILENDSLRGVYFDYILDMINGLSSYDSIAAKAERIKSLIQVHIQSDPNKFYSDSICFTNIDSDIQLRDGPSTTRIPGIKSFASVRNSAIREQILQYSDVVSGQRRIGQKRGELFARSGVSSLMISYAISKAGPVQVSLISIQGKTLQILNEKVRHPGRYTCILPKTMFPSGFYTLKMKSEGESAVTQAVILR